MTSLRVDPQSVELERHFFQRSPPRPSPFDDCANTKTWKSRLDPRPRGVEVLQHDGLVAPKIPLGLRSGRRRVVHSPIDVFRNPRTPCPEPGFAVRSDHVAPRCPCARNRPEARRSDRIRRRTNRSRRILDVGKQKLPIAFWIPAVVPPSGRVRREPRAPVGTVPAQLHLGERLWVTHARAQQPTLPNPIANHAETTSPIPDGESYCGFGHRTSARCVAGADEEPVRSRLEDGEVRLVADRATVTRFDVRFDRKLFVSWDEPAVGREHERSLHHDGEAVRRILESARYPDRRVCSSVLEVHAFGSLAALATSFDHRFRRHLGRRFERNVRARDLDVAGRL